ncbi:MAG TPA: hypothetical protein VI168_08660 [Croceibacterium sp.]
MSYLTRRSDTAILALLAGPRIGYADVRNAAAGLFAERVEHEGEAA